MRGKLGNRRSRALIVNFAIPSMRPALYARETPSTAPPRPPACCHPSMRPALYARETFTAAMASTPAGTRTFNEARALCAGNCRMLRSSRKVRVLPSMRPALYARETAEHATCVVRESCYSFNEARALCAGNSPVLANSVCPLRDSFNEARALCAGNYACDRRRLQ